MVIYLASLAVEREETTLSTTYKHFTKKVHVLPLSTKAVKDKRQDRGRPYFSPPPI